MTLRVGYNPFDAERAQRYKQAMDTCPTARYLEVLPLFCLCAQPALHHATVADLGAGTGYLAHFFAPVAKRVLLVDKSAEQLRASESPHTVVSDMCSTSQHIPPSTVDLITCLASFHHVHMPAEPDRDTIFRGDMTRHWTPERHLDVAASQALHAQALRDWCHMLKPGGTLVLIDIPGYPDAAWDRAWPRRPPHAVDTRAYHARLAPFLADWPLQVDLAVFDQLFDHGAFRAFWQTDPHLAAVRRLLRSESSTMHDLIASYRLPNSALKSCGPMVPADFFDDVVDHYGLQPHYGYYPRETLVYQTLLSAGMTDVRTVTVPTPWVFDSATSAAWFVHELLGLGQQWHRDAIPADELRALLTMLEHYLGLHTDDYGRTLLYWQLAYFVGRKPA